MTLYTGTIQTTQVLGCVPTCVPAVFKHAKAGVGWYEDKQMFFHAKQFFGGFFSVQLLFKCQTFYMPLRVHRPIHRLPLTPAQRRPYPESAISGKHRQVIVCVFPKVACCD